MTKQIFVNLAVKDLKKIIEFLQKLALHLIQNLWMTTRPV